jgi:MarR family transcriptional regulator, organic hydroperoxide resistance regulator
MPPVSPSARARTAVRQGPARLRSDPASPGFRIADYPFYLLNRIAGRYAIDMSDALKAIGMDLPTWRALMILHERSPRSVSEIAMQAVIRLSTMTRVVRRLERAGLVRLARRTSDARVTEVVITPQGLAAVRRVREVAGRVYARAFAAFAPRDIEVLNGLLIRVMRNLSLSP